MLETLKSLIQKTHKIPIMKTRVFAFLFCCMLGSFGLLNANNDFDFGNMVMKTAASEEGNLILRLANLQTEVTNIRFTNLAENNLYFSKRVTKHNGYAAELDLEKLPDGRYLLEVSQKDVVLTQVIVRENNRLLFSDIVEK